MRVACLLLLPAFAAWATGRPFIFPSLGPSAFALAVREDKLSARRVIGGHLVGVFAGLISYHLLASGLTFHMLRATWSIADLRLAASGILSLLLTTTGMLMAKARHAPACATTLIISLGLMPSLADSGIILFAVLSLYGTHLLLINVPARGRFMDLLMHKKNVRKEVTMKATQRLHEIGQSLWLDNVNREILRNGTLQRYRDEFSVTGLTSNPTIFDNAIRNGQLYDESIQQKVAQGKSGEALFFELALEDLTQAADLFRPIYDSTEGMDGWVSLEVSPLLAFDTAKTITEVAELHAKSNRPNVMIKIPGTRAGVPAIEKSIFDGVPVNVTLLFSREQYLDSAEAYMRGIERRIAAGRDPKVHSVASLFVSRWDKAVMGKVPQRLRNRLGIAIAEQAYKSYRDLLKSSRWKKLVAAGAVPQRLLWGSTGTKDPTARDTLYVEALAAPDTIDTIPEKTLLAFADHGQISDVMPKDGGQAEEVLQEFSHAGVNLASLAEELQREGAEAFDKSWDDLMECIQTKSTLFKKVG